MADGTPSSNDSASNAQLYTPRSDDISNAGPSAPSQFLTHLPSSVNPPFADIDVEPAPIFESTESLANTNTVQVDSQGRTLNPRSCVTCRKRKVKCDKVHPCNNCTRNHIECVFPAPGRAPRKARKLPDGRDRELMDRLRRLEGVVKGMGVEVPLREDGKESESRSSMEPRPTADGLTSNMDVNGGGESNTRPSSQYFDDIDHKDKTKWVEERQDRNFENRFGRLVVNEGKSRYINNSFWANLSNEVEDLKGILNQSSDDDDQPDATPASTQNAAGNHQGWVFGFSSQNVDLLPLHPMPAQIREYWETYKDRVDPLVKVLHIPSIEPTVLSAASHLSNLSKGFEALLFAIYYGATTSLNATDCAQKFGEEKSVLLARYRFAIQQALTRANFLTTEEVIVLQAFVVFLICLRRNNDARVIWTLTGLVVRIAQTIGVHRDGSHFGLNPFEVEMRRRLWWQVCILDTRASEDHGCDPTIIEQAFDTKMPLNINDVDITPEMKEFPPERQGCTDMSFCLIRFEVANTFRRINYIPPGPPKACTEYFANVTLADKEKWITECHNRLEERYLKHCDMSVPLFWVTATVARLMMSKMWLMVYHPFQRHDGGASLPRETKEKLFITSLENIEYSLLLETESRTMKWGWLFKTYMQWHALAFILSELCLRTTGDLVERAWIAVEKTRDGRWGMHVTENSQAGHLWRPLKKLYRKAKEARQKGLQEEAASKQRVAMPAQQQSQAQQQAPQQRTYCPNPKPMYEQQQAKRDTSASVTRAPLSHAQIQRLNSGIGYGGLPADKHELFMASPTASSDGGERNTMVPEDGGAPHQRQDSMRQQQQQPLPQQHLQQHHHPPQPPPGIHSGFTGYAGGPAQGFAAPAQQQTYMPTAQMPSGPQFGGANFFVNTNANTYGGANNVDFSTLNNHNPAALTNQSPHSIPPTPTSATHSTFPRHGFDRNSGWSNAESNHDLDISVMDTSGDLNWANWDQLVKQFGGGMEVDSGQPGSGVATDWAGGSWDGMMNGAGGNVNGNMRMGPMNMGMGGGDWF